jgi:N-acetylmuramoyl-L-alanine amidase
MANPSPGRKWHTASAPHRKLFRTARGEDVKAFERGLNERLAKMPPHLAADVDPVKVDGVFDDADLALWRAVRYAIGLPDGHPPTIAAQVNVRRPSTRTPAAKRRAKKRRAGTAKPRIITSAALGLTFAWVFGAKGRPFICAGHYTAGARAADVGELAAEMRSVHRIHAAQGWGGGSYDYLIADDGTIGCLNPIGRKGAHVGGANSGNVGICCPGTTGDRPTEAQRASLRWLLANAHTKALPAAHRSPVDLRNLPLLGHHEFPGNATACPGLFLDMYHAKGASR